MKIDYNLYIYEALLIINSIYTSSTNIESKIYTLVSITQTPNNKLLIKELQWRI
jgi:hypothetical protein